MKNKNTKDIILSEALRLFAERGYDAVGVTEIAEAVGIKAPSLYKHYKSKRDIFDSIIKRVNEMDYEKARDGEMPEQSIDKAEDSYKDIPINKIAAYTKEMFLHWTEEEFSSRFRRLLTLEQYKNHEMSELYQQYISGGPMRYMADVFLSMTDSEAEAMQTALEFYGPIYLLYSIYDGTSDKERVMSLLQNHLEVFSKQINQNPVKTRRKTK